MEFQAKSVRNNNFLPPDVVGFGRGILNLKIGGIQWRVNGYQQLEARIIWWGQSHENATVLKLTSDGDTVLYEISTNPELFKKYLQSCEAIEIQITSLKTNRLIGTSFIQIPPEILDFDENFPVVFSKRYPITSTKNLNIGSLSVALKLVLFEDLKKEDKFIGNNFKSIYEKKDYSLVSSFREKKNRESSIPKSSRVWQFLRGKDMDSRDEMETLKEICHSSPANSIIEAMDEELTLKLKDFYYNNNKENRNISNENLKIKTCNREHVESKESRSSGTQTNSTEKTDNNKPEAPNNNLHSVDKQNNIQVSLDEFMDEQNSTEYQGLFYVGGFKPMESGRKIENFYIISSNLSSNQNSLIKSGLSDHNLFLNYLKFFPMSLSQEYLEQRMKNNFLIIEIWSRQETDVKIGTARVGLHQFYVAFKDSVVKNRLLDLTMPVIAIDGWTDVQLKQSEQVGQLELVLAIGTRSQIDYLVKMKRLLVGREEPPEMSTRSQTSSILSAFLDNLSQQIAIKREAAAAPPQKTGEIRRTSDLLDVLQKALVNPPDPKQLDLNLGPFGSFVSPKVEPLPKATDVTDKPATILNPEPVFEENSQDYFNVVIDIERAMHLPKINGKGGNNNKKCSRRNKTPRKSQLEVEPSCYATFEARGSPVNMVKSVEGYVYTTRVIERTCNPCWNKSFEVQLHRDLLTHPEKYFIVKLWRKAVVDIVQCRPLPNPIEDVVIGFSTIDLKVLTAGLPEISGWYNIVYFNGKCNGQIKIKIRPMEPIPHKDVLANPQKSTESSQATNLMMNLNLDEVGNASLSRALKRKFTELEEITQRLRARLHDVTASNSEKDDEEIEDIYDDEFEKDLNTSVDEVDDETDGVDFNWLGALTDEQRKTVEQDASTVRSDDTFDLYTNNGASKSSEIDKVVTQTTDNANKIESLEDAMKQTVITDDTIINSKN